jgi:hypothetical protein
MLICIVFVLVMSLCGCGMVKEEAGMPRFYFGVEGANLLVFDGGDYDKIKKVVVEPEGAKTYRGDDIKKVKGIYFSKVLEYVGAGEYSSVTLTSHTGDTVEYTHEIINDSGTLLVFEINDDTLWGDKGLAGAEGVEMVEVLALNYPADMWLWQLDKITINP